MTLRGKAVRIMDGWKNQIILFFIEENVITVHHETNDPMVKNK